MQFEKRQNVSDEPLTTCEECHGKLEKQWSLSGFQFKGAGWYVTDYAGQKKEKPEKGAPSESTAKPETASDSKEAVKTTVSTTVTESVSKPVKE